MASLTGILVPLIIVILIALIIWWVTERFSPDPLITKIVQVVIFVLVLIFLITRLLPMLGAG